MNKVSDAESLKLYFGGWDIKRVSAYVRNNEKCTAKEARERVEWVIYSNNKEVEITDET